MCNADIRAAAKNAGVFLYQIAAAMGVSEPTMTRKLRFELSDAEKKPIFEAIERLRQTTIEKSLQNKNVSR